MASKKVCVIGAGLSGLVTIKELKAMQHDVVCYESREAVGGALAKGKVYDSLLLTVSNYFMAYSAYPPHLNEGRRYWTAYEYHDYLSGYCEKFGLTRHIQFNTGIKQVVRQGSGYLVTILQDGEEKTEQFDAVVVCTGTNRVPFTPDIEGLDSFNGKVIHTSEYSSTDSFEGKKVICVGIGESGADICHEICQSAQETTLAVRNLPSLVPRWINQHTGDAYTSRAFNAMGREGINFFMRTKGKWHYNRGNHASKVEQMHYEWLSKTGGYFNRFLTKNDVFLTDVADGDMDLKVSEIVKVDGNKVMFSDNTEVEADVLVFNTGYSEDFSFVDSIVKMNNIRDLYKHMIHPDIGETLAFIGWARPTQGGVPACSEMQTRYLALLLAGERKLPETQALKALIEQDSMWEETYFSNSPHVKGLVDYHQFMMSLAELIDCKPKINPLLQPRLFYKYWFGCHLAALYRLNGPGADPEQCMDLIKRLPVASSVGRNLTMSFVRLVMKCIPESMAKRINGH